MTPADEVKLTCTPKDTIRRALDLVIQNHDLGAVVVLHPNGNKHIPVGIVTQSDLLMAYSAGLSLDKRVETIMSRTIESIHEDQTRDVAAEHFENTKHHHAFVVNSDEQWVGMITAWDVATELARDNRAWPWNREALEMIQAKYSPHTEKKVLDIPKHPDDIEPHSFLGIAGSNE